MVPRFTFYCNSNIKNVLNEDVSSSLSGTKDKHLVCNVSQPVGTKK